MNEEIVDPLRASEYFDEMMASISCSVMNIAAPQCAKIIKEKGSIDEGALQDLIMKCLKIVIEEK